MTKEYQYSNEFKKVMQANLDSTSMSSNRIDEILKFAKAMKLKKIGIAHCITFTSEAKILKEYLSKYFEVYTIDCKCDRITQSEILGGFSSRILCNPLGQADFLNKKNTDLNISMGLCVGHDMIFSKASNAYVTNLFDKDFTNNNNMDEAINEIKRKIN